MVLSLDILEACKTTHGLSNLFMFLCIYAKCFQTQTDSVPVVFYINCDDSIKLIPGSGTAFRFGIGMAHACLYMQTAPAGNFCMHVMKLV